MTTRKRSLLLAGAHPGRAVVLLSGGLDSAAALFWWRSTTEELHAISIDYGQRHRVELAAAREIANLADVPLAERTVTLPTLADSSLGSGTFDAEPTRAVVPGRNLVLLTIAAAHAKAVGARRIVIGACLDDAVTFPDCRPAFLDAAQRALGLGIGHCLTVSAPWVYQRKAEIIASVRGMGGDAWEALAWSWSCYDPRRVEGGVIACGACNACAARAQGFEVAGEVDPAAGRVWR